MTTLNHIGQRLATSLLAAKQWETANNRELLHAQKVNIVGAGGALTAAYEQLRNAAENTEEHLLLQNAIKRFYRQLFVTRDDALIRTSGNELAVELTLAGYIPNDSLLRSQLDTISGLAVEHYEAYELLQKRRSLASDKTTGWVLDTLAVQVESILNDHRRDTAFIDFAYSYLMMLIPEEAITSRMRTEDYSAALYAAIHKSLLKSDTAVIRTTLLMRYGVSMKHLEEYVTYNKQIDNLLVSPQVDTLLHIVDRQGAPLRIIRRMIEDRADFAELLPRREAFLDAFEKQVNTEYSRIGKRINRAIIRSVIFLIITKFLIGIAIEVPYDIWAHGKIGWQPLLINLLFPPFYMIALRLTHTLPGFANTSALIDRADTMLYGERVVLMKKQLADRGYGPIFSAIYAVTSLVIFGAVMWVLLLLGFSLVHIAIFLVFISAASFLGFRLSRLIRELEVVRSSSNGMTFVRDLIYLPFVVVGRWMSDKYSKLNIVTIILDMLIELPLKTVLRLVRQWGAFIDDRKDRIT
ncbi:hypothetical protein IPP92_00730 [Candidatus Saccharibacteria bacterium]|nr:MAG: hypothetical protein IPP92_00730 [Candidatus Saccharibacteria bacterium]